MSRPTQNLDEGIKPTPILLKNKNGSVNRSISLHQEEMGPQQRSLDNNNENKTNSKYKVFQKSQEIRSPIKHVRQGFSVESTSPLKDKKMIGGGQILNQSGNISHLISRNDKLLDLNKLILEEEDERFRYLLKYGIVRKLDNNNMAIFAELPQIPGIWVFYRKLNEKNDKLILDNKELNHLPLLEGEEKLKLFSLKHNYIKTIDNLVSLPNLIYLDLYDNQIQEIDNISSITSLRVLMIAKNHITKIKNLDKLVKLDVLDLHSNFITKIEGLNRLFELRILNLANNSISKIEELDHLTKLSELNLRLNHIDELDGLAKLKSLTKLYLSNNRIFSMKTLRHLKNLNKLQELSLEENPICTNTIAYYKSIYDVLPGLKMLDYKSFEMIKVEISTLIGYSESNNMTISGVTYSNPNNVNLNSPMIQQAINSKNKKVELPQIKNTNIILNQGSNTDLERCQSKQNNPMKKSMVVDKMSNMMDRKDNIESPSREKYSMRKKDSKDERSIDSTKEMSLTPEEVIIIIAEQFKSEVIRVEKLKMNGITSKKELYKESVLEGGHAEMESNNILYLYGNSFEIVLQNKHFQETVEIIYLEYVIYDMIIQSKYLNILRNYKKLTKLVLRNNNISSFLQIARLEALSTLKKLTISFNPICSCILLKEFIAYRFPDLEEFNEEKLEQTIKNDAKTNFQEFDNVLTIPSKIIGIDLTKLSSQEKININSKLLDDGAEQVAKKVLKYAYKDLEIKRKFEKEWNDYMNNLIRSTLIEYTASIINHEMMQRIFHHQSCCSKQNKQCDPILKIFYLNFLKLFK